MSTANNRSSSYVAGFITNITKDDVLKEFNINFVTEFPDDSLESLNNIIYRNSSNSIDNALSPILDSNEDVVSYKKIYVSNLKFLDNDDPQEENTFINTVITVIIFDYVFYENIRYLNITCKWKPINYNEISPNFSFDNSHDFFTSLNDPSVTHPHEILFSKIGAPKPVGNSGRMSPSIKTILNSRSYDFGTLPSNKITTGKKLQSFNDPYVEKNLIEFIELDNVHDALGVPLIPTTDNSFYITTNSDLLSEGTIDPSSNMYESQYDLKNSVLSGFTFTDDNFDGQITTRRTVTPENLDALIKQERFEEEFAPFVESDYYYREDVNTEFYNENLNKEDGEYDLGKQKQIKIVLDFSGDGEEYNNLHLMNTKFSFINPLPEPSSDISLFNTHLYLFGDTIVDTQYFNFLKGSVPSSYSSHHMPTAYWNNTYNRWSYLDAGSDFDDDTYLGAKIPDNSIPQNRKTQIQDCFRFETNGDFVVQDPSSFNALYYNKPILTTPGFRNDGSFLLSNNSNQYNKSALCKITDSYGFPYKGNWQPTNDHLIRMSEYLSKDFLLEKMIIKGKYTTRGEMPVKKGNFTSGYFKIPSPQLLDVNTFHESYTLKDNHHNYISNSVTFFLLNEQENKNFVNQKINVDTLQHYTYLLDQQAIDNNFSNSIEKLSGNFETDSNRLSVKAYNVEKNEVYTFDDYNILNVETSKRNTNFSKSRFHYLTSVNDNESNVDSIYYRSVGYPFNTMLNPNTIHQNFYLNYLYDGYKISNIKLESINNFNVNKSREIVTYSNLLLTKKMNDVELDERLLTNIDLHKIETVNNEDDMHLNQDNPEEFVIHSFCKNNTDYSSYTDETELKIGSNFKLLEESQPATPFSFNLTVGNVSDLATFNGDNSEIETILGNNLNTTFPISDINTNSIKKLEFSLRNVDTNVIRKFIEVKFTFTNPEEYIDVARTRNYQDYFSWNSADDFYGRTDITQLPVYMRDFVRHDYVLADDGYYYNQIIINLRFLDIFNIDSQDISIMSDFLNRMIKSDNIAIDNNIIKTARSESNDLSGMNSDYFGIETLNDWRNFNTSEKTKAFNIFVYNAIFNKSLNKGISSETSPFYGGRENVFPLGLANPFTYQPRIPSEAIQYKENDYLDYSDLFNVSLNNETNLVFNSNNSNSSILIEEKIPFNSDYSLFDASGNVLVTTHNQSLGATLAVDNINVGVNATLEDLNLHNKKYILEGSTKGTNNIDIETNRIIDKEILSQNIVPEFKSKSGKILHSGNNINQIVKSNYLLKPSDNLVFGVTSNCNGQVMPTVFKLHDKVEITLIGRDYINKDDNKHKNNQSQAIRKNVYGDDYIEKAEYTIYDTKNAYYDNVWDKSSLKNSKEEFLTKKVLKLNSSRENGTYSGFVSLNDEFISLRTSDAKKPLLKPLLIRDTIHPSLGKVFKDCLGMQTVLSKNHNDRRETKVIISENFENIDNSVNVINKWHKTYHLDEYSSFFDNLHINSTTYPEIFDDRNVDVGIYYDTSSYDVNPSIKEFESYVESLLENYTSDRWQDAQPGTRLTVVDGFKFKLKKYLKSLKSFLLPSSLMQNYQNGIEIQNENTYNTWNNSQLTTSKHVKSDKNINKNTVDESKLSVVTKASLQYFDLKLRSIINISEKESIPLVSDAGFHDYLLDNNFVFYKGINRNSLGEYVNDIYDLDNNFETNNPQWHLVIEVTFSQFINMMTQSNITVTSQNISSFINKDIDIFLYNYEYVNEIWSYNNEPIVSKVARVVRVISGEEIVVLAIPLYFWETLETSDPYFNFNAVGGEFSGAPTDPEYSRKANERHKNNPTAAENFLKPAWYARLSNVANLSDNVQIKYLTDVYKPFVVGSIDNEFNYDHVAQKYSIPPQPFIIDTFENKKSEISSYDDYEITFPFNLPYRHNEVLINFSNFNNQIFNNSDSDPNEAESVAANVSEALVFNPNVRRFAISLCDFTTKINNLSPVDENQSSNIKKLNNRYNLLNHTQYLTHRKYFENDSRKIKLRDFNKIDPQEFNENLNEKIYRSKIYKKNINNKFIETKYYLIYKIHKMYSYLDESDNSSILLNNDIVKEDIEYNIIEVIAIDNSYTLFEKHVISDDLLIGFKNDVIRIYEDDLRKNNYFNNDFNLNTPYFEINLSSKTKQFSHSGEDFDNINQILETSLGLDSSLDITQNQYTSFERGSAGSLLFLIKDNSPNNYKNFEQQEDAIKSFFYGFSKGKNRFPVEKIDGFKFGVQSPVQQTAKHFYNNRRYGNLADKLLRTKNYVTAYKDNRGNEIINYTVEKRFVNDLDYIVDASEIANLTTTFNKDVYARCKKPFIEST